VFIDYEYVCVCVCVFVCVYFYVTNLIEKLLIIIDNWNGKQQKKIKVENGPFSYNY
jgi:hypothetical protein